MVSKVSIVTLVLAILFSCSTSNEVVKKGLLQKRKYNKGWYVNKSAKVKEKQSIVTNSNFADMEKEEVSEEKEETNAEANLVSSQYVSEINEKSVQEVAPVASLSEKVSVKQVFEIEEQKAVEVELTKIIERKPEEILMSEKKSSGRGGDTSFILLIILAIILPPLAVYLFYGVIRQEFWISVVLTLLFWLPGVVYALYLILG